jgi:hypothetical protein
MKSKNKLMSEQFLNFLTTKQIQKHVDATSPLDLSTIVANRRLLYNDLEDFSQIIRYNQVKSTDLQPEVSKNKLVTENNINNVNEFDSGIKEMLSKLKNYCDVLKLLSLSQEAFNSIDFAANNIINNGDLQFYHLNHELFKEYKKQKSQIGVQLIRSLGNSGLEMISNPNFLVNPKYMYSPTYNDYLKWLHGDNRTI